MTSRSDAQENKDVTSGYPFPTVGQLERELRHEQRKVAARRITFSTLGALVVAAAIAVILSFTMLPLLQITGTSMEPTLTNGQYVLALKRANFHTGDMVAFYNSNKVLVKRVIATAGQWVDIDEEGNVSVDGQVIDEPYIAQKAYGKVNITLPYQVPDGALFVMGDNRAVSLDSRSTTVGCVYEEQVVGKIALRVWPATSFAFL